MRTLLLALCGTALLLAGPVAGRPEQADKSGPVKGGAIPPADAVEKKFPDFDKFMKGAKEYDGLFKLYHKDENLFMEIKSGQLNKPYLLPIAVARGMGLGGFTLNFDEQWVLLFKRASETKLHLVRRN